MRWVITGRMAKQSRNQGTGILIGICRHASLLSHAMQASQAMHLELVEVLDLGYQVVL